VAATLCVWLLLLLLGQVCEEPNAMAVASCSSNGQPSLRYVLLKGESSERLR
jgi:pyridoxine/pyridoxamine 5'-phosphate oxidase